MSAHSNAYEHCQKQIPAALHVFCVGKFPTKNCILCRKISYKKWSVALKYGMHLAPFFWFLVSFGTCSDVFDLARQDLSEGGVAVCSRSTFFQLWKKDFKHVKIPPVSALSCMFVFNVINSIYPGAMNHIYYSAVTIPVSETRFTTCDVCSAIREARMRTLDPTVRKWLAHVLEKHSELVMYVGCCLNNIMAVDLCVPLTTCRTERAKYVKHQNKAEKHQKSYMSVIIDGMDQSKTFLPHIPSNLKSLAGQFTLPTHLTGIHAHGRLTLIVVDWGQFPHDSNLTINALMLMLLRYKV